VGAEVFSLPKKSDHFFTPGFQKPVRAVTLMCVARTVKSRGSNNEKRRLMAGGYRLADLLPGLMYRAVKGAGICISLLRNKGKVFRKTASELM